MVISEMSVTFIIFAGLPATGKSAVAREVARRTGAMWLRIDSIEQAIRDSGVAVGSLDDAGYRAGYALAGDNLRLGRNVVADSVNSWTLTRDAWRAAGERAAARIVEVEVICSDQKEHRRRVETRVSDVPGLALPTWAEVLGLQRDCDPWTRDRLVIDTAVLDLDAAVEAVLAEVG